MLSGFLAASTMALLGSARSPVPTYPIEYHTLKMLCEKSDLVVYARVDRIEEDYLFLDWFDRPRTIAVLQVLETVHGAGQEEVQVEFMPNMACPRPASYPIGEKVLAFLTRDEARSSYSTAGLSYGSKSLDEESVVVYSKHIRSFYELERRASNHEEMSEEEYGVALTDWCIELCVDFATRAEGAVELTKPDLELKQPGKKVGFIRPLLTGDQLRRIHTLFYDRLSLDEEAVYLLAELLQAHGDPEVSPRIARYLRSRVGEPVPVPYAVQYMEILERSLEGASRPAARRLARSYESALWSKTSVDEDPRSRSHRLAEITAPILREFLELFSTDEREDGK